MYRVMVIAVTCAVLVSAAMAVRELVIIDKPQLAQKVEGVVLGPDGSPISEVTVTDRNENGAVVLRSTKTDSRGHFYFPTQHGKTIYCLRFDHPLWNPLQLTVQVDKHALQRGITGQTAHRGLSRWF